MNFTASIIRWYEENKRQLPWRETSDPYKIWVSEVILQQTRVEQGYSYYGRFLDRFPDIKALATAAEDDVMKAWQGLGYYSRARNMQHAAREIYFESHSVFPSSYHELIRLKGIGDYSASAIASIAFNEPCPVIDGNVLRVMTRFIGITHPVNKTSARKQVREVLKELMDQKQPGIFNQAVMELGALVCIPRKPRCQECPLSMECYAFRHSMTASLPLIDKGKEKEVHHYIYLVFISEKDKEWFTWLNKRTGMGIWKGLYDFPMIETKGDVSPEEALTLPEFKKLTRNSRLTAIPPKVHRIRHILTHRDLRVTFMVIHVNEHFHPEHLKTSLKDIYNYPVSRLIENFLKKLDFDRVYF